MLAFAKRHPLPIALTSVVGLPIIIFVLWATITLHTTYSSGERAGFLQKISQRGWLCKTWEGEIQLSSIPGSAPTLFAFTTRSDSIGKVLSGLAGKEVSLHYEQHKGVPTSCFGDTEYFVTAVRAVDAK